MYSDKDGAASKESETQYQAQIRPLLFLTSVLSLLGFSVAALDGQYVNESLRLSWSNPSALAQLLWPLLSIHSLALYWQTHPPALWSAALRGSLLAILIVAVQIHAKYLDPDGSFWDLSAASCELYLAFVIAFTQLLFPRRPNVFSSDGKPIDRESSVSVLARYSMQWCENALAIAGSGVRIDHLPRLNWKTRSGSQPLITLSNISLWNQVLSERFYGFALQWTLMLVRSVITFGAPYCIMQLLRCLEDNNTPTNTAWIWLMGITVSSIADTVLHYHMAWIQWSEMGIPVRAQLIMAIFSKALRCKDTKLAGDKPEATNLISSDTVSFSKFTAVNYILPFSFVRFFLSILFLLRLLGWKSTAVAVIVTVATVPIHKRVINQERVAKKSLVVARDKKTRTTSEALHALRQIKFSALEAQWEERIEVCRQEEMKHIRRAFIATNIRSVWKVASPFIVATAAVFTYVYTENQMSSSVIFPMIELLPHLQGTLGFVPVVFQDYFAARANAKRMETFLRAPELQKTVNPSPTDSVTFQDASFAWPSDEVKQPDGSARRFILQNISLKFPVGKLSVIHGETGSGKSLLLAAIIGEIDLLSGSIAGPSSNQPVAFVSQTPWLQNATVRDNILFGSNFDEVRYQKVLQACALEPDLAALPKGDQTHIGLRGVKLSGGQRARVSFGRALYSKAQLLVLDDIFSALDTHIAREIFTALTSELCEGRTRILATHQVSLCLPKARYLVEVHNNTTRSAQNIAFEETAVKGAEVRVTSEVNAPLEKPKKAASTNLNVRPARAFAQTDLDTYKDYFTATGGWSFFIVYITGIVSKQAVAALTTWALGQINTARPGSTSRGQAENSLQGHLQFYLLGTVLAVVLDADARQVDDALLQVMSEFVNCLIRVMIVLGIGMYNSVYTGLLTVVILYWCSQVGKGYMKARTLVKRGESESNAEILEFFTASAAGVSTIRAFGVVNQFADQMHRRIDDLSTVRRHFWIFNRWLGLQMSLAGIFFSTGTGIILLLSRSVIDASHLGFTLTFSMGFAHASFSSVNTFGMLETYMQAANAIISYSELKTERQGGDDVPTDWPSRGEVQVKELNVAYSPDLPKVLKNVSFSVGAGKRIGIVGRTGAGKSSLTLALLRFIEPLSGAIFIDGIDISKIKLESLRSRIGFIPQDPVLFSGSMESNLDYFHQFPKNRLNEVLRRVGLLSEDENRKAGSFTLESQISAGGGNMSQGQRQLLCLARVLLKDPKIVILDEATSAVDDKTDQEIQDTIRNEFSRTLIVVAHRLRTVASFDQIVVIEDGRVGEIGSPAELLQSKGLFYDLVQKSEDRDVVTSIACQ
ncbi:P-loop containing nucleoside triphosphate hydrolase protein [Penicillium malachiteum]|uniref:P-loop containing nucleoside triphosphate hydrolase protein n=1 Tax=Penicillium malachiteum TaxID=1324776 RepID=UPI002548355E|nr:P-loop containing nucleoside triphosphate hydrolase protein [Penicillium malachiteum]KAJ5728886.1 P-loop containing nucleoside triphosphate hydrolase protein [Penicillium malachiteum]